MAHCSHEVAQATAQQAFPSATDWRRRRGCTRLTAHNIESPYFGEPLDPTSSVNSLAESDNHFLLVVRQDKPRVLVLYDEQQPQDSEGENLWDVIPDMQLEHAAEWTYQTYRQFHLCRNKVKLDLWGAAP